MSGQRGGGWLPPVVRLLGLSLVLAGVGRPLADDAARSAFASLPSPGGPCPVAFLGLSPPGGARFAVDGAWLRDLARALGPETTLVVDLPPSRVAPPLPELPLRSEGLAPLARSEELVRFLPGELPPHLAPAVAGRRGRDPSSSWWRRLPLWDPEALMDPRLVRWVDTVGTEGLLERPTTLARLRGRLVLVGLRDPQGGPLTYGGQVSETALLAATAAGRIDGGTVHRPSATGLVLLLVAVVALVDLAGAALGRSAAWSLALGLVLGGGLLCRLALGQWGVLVDPWGAALVALAAAACPWAAGRQRRAAPEAGELRDEVAAAWAAEGHGGFDEALARLRAVDGPGGELWEAVAEQTRRGDASSLDPAALPLHAGHVEVLYALGRAFEAGYHWVEALAAYDWAALKRRDYLDLGERRREAREAAAGNLEFVDLTELLASLDPRYRDLEVLGQGGMGVVLSGHDDFLDRPVALKLVLPACLADPGARERFLRETETLGALNHPNIVQIYAVHRGERLFYYAMELLRGRGLRDAVGLPSGASLAASLGHMATLASTMAFVHGQGILHRDLKPDNVLVVEGRGPVLIDFGIARASGHDAGLTQAGQLMGTLAYMAPELVRGGGGGPEADLFAFGVILYELVTGTQPFTTPLMLASRPPAPIRELRPEAPPALDDLVRRLMAVEPSGRPEGFGDVASELSGLAKGIF